MRKAVLFVLLNISFAVPCLAGGSMDNLFQAPVGKSMRSSSYDAPEWTNGNNDRRELLPGKPVVLIDSDGPGIVRHLWMTIASRDRQYSRLYAIRVYYDGSDIPAVEAPIGDFFAVGHGLELPVNSLPVDVSSDGRARNAWWPMPFKKHIKITVTNEAKGFLGAVIYWYVDWEKVDALPDDTLYFHAQYRQQFPCKPGDYTILETRGRGKYVGTVLSVLHNQQSWFGEGDDRFYIDGETAPSIHGTGTEDYFSDAWGFRPFQHPYHGVTVWEGENIDSRGTAYRWHTQDPISFQKSLTLTIEHKGPVFDENDVMVMSYGERSDNFSSVAFWYQEGTAQTGYSMPRGEKRLPPYEYMEAEQALLKAGDRPAGVTTESGYGYSGGSVVRFTPKDQGDSYNVIFETEFDLRHALRADIFRGPDAGVYRVELDGEVVAPEADLWAGFPGAGPLRLGVRKLAPGPHNLTFTYLRPGAGGGRGLALDAVYARPIKIYKTW